MNIKKIVPFICFAFLTVSFSAAAKDSTNSVRTTAEERDFFAANAGEISSFLRENFANANSGMVVGLLDQRGTRIFATGRLDNGTTNLVNGDTVFEIGSITKTFTVLLLMDMVERGEMKLDVPVAEYLPAFVKLPSCNGRQITLQNLAAQDSGLPFNPDGLSGNDWLARYDAFTIDKMYSFLHTLTNEPGGSFQYSNLGMSLLGHAIALKAGTNFESLVLERICRPLNIDSSCITLTPELKARAAAGHDATGKQAPDYHLQALAPAGALHSTAKDLLKYLSANLDLTHSRLTPLMDKMQLIRHRDSPDMGKTAMPWYDGAVYNPPGAEFLGHAGGTGGSSTFIGFDRIRRRGVVVLSNQTRIHSSSVGWRILQVATLSGRNATTIMPVKEYTGSGLAYDLDEHDHTLRVTKVYPDTSAAKAGVQAGWMVQKINGISTAGKSPTECVALGPGGAGAVVRMQLVSPERTKTNIVNLTKQRFLAD